MSSSATTPGKQIAALVLAGRRGPDDPLAAEAIPFFLLLGIGQMSCFAAAQALIGQEAPLKERGAVLGTFGLCGAAGIMLATGVGGWLFDAWMHAGPFVVVGFANVVIVLLALVVRMQSPGTSQPSS